MNRFALLAIPTLGLVLTGVTGAAAQSPSPDPSAAVPSIGPIASVPTDAVACSDLAGVLPRSAGGWPLTWSVAEGPAEPVPGYPDAALVATLGIAPAVVCVVTFQYDVTTPGTIVRFTGAQQDGLLAAYIADAQATVAAHGGTLLSQDATVGERPAVELLRDGFDRVAWQVADAIVEMPTGNAGTELVSAALPGLAGPLPHASPPAPVPTEHPGADASCAKIAISLPGSSQSGVGPDAIAGPSYNGDAASPAVMSYGLLDTLGIGPWDVCRVDVQAGDTGQARGRLWRLGKGGAATLQPYLDDVTATLQAAGATVAQGSETIAKLPVVTLAVTRPEGTATWYYAATGTGFAEFQTRAETQTLLPDLPKARKR